MDSSGENNPFSRNFSLNIQGELKVWHRPLVMGILNLTPDSFYDGGRYPDERSIKGQVERMLDEGADIIDVGAFSSRPGAQMISEKEELERLEKPLKWISTLSQDCLISVDTYRSSCAKLALSLGAHLINDITAGTWDEELPLLLAKERVPYIIMHMQGKPEDMQKAPRYKDVSQEIYKWFSKRLSELDALGIHDIIIDPGFGFGKTLEHNYQLLKDLPHFMHLNKSILVGLSRKGMIQKLIDQKAEDALNGTTAAHVIALMNGANILRVHDVKEAKEAISIVDFYQKQ